MKSFREMKEEYALTEWLDGLLGGGALSEEMYDKLIEIEERIKKLEDL